MNSKKTILLLFFYCITSFAFAVDLKLKDLKTNYKTNPIGLDVSLVRFSWKLESVATETMQKSYEIRIGLNETDLLKNKNLTWTSGKVESDQSVNVTYSGPALKAKTRYFWQVRIIDNHQNPSNWSTIQFFETSMLNKSDWTASWIEMAIPTDGKVGSAPIFAKQFDLSKVR
jgi:alpha-L-rhamnosidase